MPLARRSRNGSTCSAPRNAITPANLDRIEALAVLLRQRTPEQLSTSLEFELKLAMGSMLAPPMPTETERTMDEKEHLEVRE